jgi:hypothetical protein
MASLIRRFREFLLPPVRKRFESLVERVTAAQRTQIGTLQAQCEGLHAKIDAVRAESDRLHALIDAMRTENDALHAGIDAVRSESDHLHALIDAMRSEDDRLHALIDAVRTESDRLHVQVGALRLQNDSLYAEVSGLHARSAEVGALRDQIFTLERLVTGTRAARPPGATSAVAALDNPAVSIVIPTFNRPGFLGEAITSVQRQSFENWELAIIGDGSSEETAAAVAPFLDDPRIRFIWQERAGSASARNRGISETHAPLIAYLDDDNLWYPDFLVRAVDCMGTRPDVDVLYGALVTYAHGLDRGCILWRRFDRETLLAGNFIDTSVIVHRRTLVERYGAWDPSVNRLCDWDLMLRYTAERPTAELIFAAVRHRSENRCYKDISCIFYLDAFADERHNP